MNISFTILGTPIAKGRPKFWHRGKCTGTYTPKKTRTYEDSVISQALAHRFENPLIIPLAVKLRFFLPIPSSFSKKRRSEALQGTIRPDKRPDIDNLQKSILDPLNTIFWDDDKRIVSICAEKYYSDQPRTDVEISDIF